MQHDGPSSSPILRFFPTIRRKDIKTAGLRDIKNQDNKYIKTTSTSRQQVHQDNKYIKTTILNIVYMMLAVS